MEAGEVVPHLRVNGFCGRGEGFGLQQQIGRDDLAVGPPSIGSDGEGLEMRYPRPEPFEGLVATTAHFDGKDASAEARHSNPYP